MLPLVLIVDQIRFYRWRALVRIADRAREIRAQRGISSQSIPLKVLLPILEEGSKEDDTSDMCERWATLLANSDSEYNSFDLVCVDILSKISKLDAEVVDAIGTYRHPVAFGNKLREDVFSKEPRLKAAISRFEKGNSNFDEQERNIFYETVQACLEGDLRYCWERLRWNRLSPSPRTFSSKFIDTFPEAAFVQRTLGLVEQEPAGTYFYPDLSPKIGRWDIAQDQKFTDTSSTFVVYRFRLTQVGELFWQKVSGKI